MGRTIPVIDNATLTQSGGILKVKDSGIGTNQLANGSVTNEKLGSSLTPAQFSVSIPDGFFSYRTRGTISSATLSASGSGNLISIGSFNTSRSGLHTQGVDVWIQGHFYVTGFVSTVKATVEYRRDGVVYNSGGGISAEYARTGVVINSTGRFDFALLLNDFTEGFKTIEVFITLDTVGSATYNVYGAIKMHTALAQSTG